MPTAYLSIGSNLGDRVSMLRYGLAEVGRLRGTVVTEVSPLYESAPWGVLDQPVFYNAAAAVETELTPEELLVGLKGIEHEAGRTGGRRWGPRVLDIDILLYDDVKIDRPELTVPHLRMWERRFVLEPLAAIWPGDEAPDGGDWAERLAAVADQELALVAEDWLEAGTAT